MTRICLIAEPIHAAAIALLTANGVEVRHASTPDLAAIPQETADVDAIIVRNALPGSAIDASPRLVVIGNHGTGSDAVDVAHATALGIPVVNTPTSNVGAVAEHALMLMLATARRAVCADAATRRADTRFKRDHVTLSLAGKTLGVIGYGRTGQLVAGLAIAIGMDVVVWSPRANTAAVDAAGSSSSWTHTLAAAASAAASAEVRASLVARVNCRRTASRTSCETTSSGSPVGSSTVSRTSRARTGGGEVSMA